MPIYDDFKCPRVRSLRFLHMVSVYDEVRCVSVCVLLAEALLGITKTRRSYSIWNHLTETTYL